MPRANHVEIVMACEPDEVAAHSDRTLEAEFVEHKNGSVLIVFQVIFRWWLNQWRVSTAPEFGSINIRSDS